MPVRLRPAELHEVLSFSGETLFPQSLILALSGSWTSCKAFALEGLDPLKRRFNASGQVVFSARVEVAEQLNSRQNMHCSAEA
jgi:hypothetical protein